MGTMRNGSDTLHGRQGIDAGEQTCFATTHWSVVLRAGQPGMPGVHEALERLCLLYWYPIYAYVRRRGYAPEDAQDLTQEFFAHMLERNVVARADPHKGRFRSFLLGAINHFLAHQWRKAHAAKRGGKLTFIPLADPAVEERYLRETTGDVTPERTYERRWALTVLDHALSKLQEDWSRTGRGAQFEALKPFLSGEAVPGEYTALAGTLQMTPNSVAVAVHRLRQSYREAVRDEIAQTVSGPEELEEELRHLLELVS
jgi:DNA-directed RNA polymerase specialized sigma24 family protein